MGYSVAAAAAVVGLSKTAVLRAIQAGLISGTKNEINEWQVDPAELHHLAELCRLYSPDVGSSEFTSETVALAGQAELVRSRAWLSDAQVRRLAGLATSDQKAQQAARRHWSRLITAHGRSDVGASDAETVRRKPSELCADQARPEDGSTVRPSQRGAYCEDLLPSTPIEFRQRGLDHIVLNAGPAGCISKVSALFVKTWKRRRGANAILSRKVLEKLRRLAAASVFSDHRPMNMLGGSLLKLIALGKVLVVHVASRCSAGYR